jgi:hypothetical protein
MGWLLVKKIVRDILPTYIRDAEDLQKDSNELSQMAYPPVLNYSQ